MQTCPLTLSCSNITYASVYLWRKLGFVSQNGLDRFAFVPSCNQGKLLLTTTNDNVNTSNWIKTKPTSYGIYRRLWVNLSQPSADYITITVHQWETTDIQSCPIKLPPLFRAPDVWIIPVWLIRRLMREWCHLYPILIEILQQKSFQYISIICSCSVNIPWDNYATCKACPFIFVVLLDCRPQTGSL